MDEGIKQCQQRTTVLNRRIRDKGLTRRIGLSFLFFQTNRQAGKGRERKRMTRFDVRVICFCSKSFYY